MLLSYGFRPFFLLGAIWAALAMVLWLGMLGGFISLPIKIDPVSWHAHEFLFGYLGAIIAGFLLTAIPSWTGRPPVTGPRLAVLVVMWILGRVVFSTSLIFSSLIVVAIDLLFPILLTAVVIYEITAGKNWRNLIIVLALAAFTIANGIFHLETNNGVYGAQGFGLRFGLAAVLMQISIIGGRVIPFFTRNWITKTGRKNSPAEPMQGFDIATLLVTLPCLLTWVVWPSEILSGYALLVVGLLQALRLARWAGLATLSNPLLFVLHAGYTFIPLGAFFIGLSIIFPDFSDAASAQHMWMAGAIGTMTLALMTRATLGHSGRDLHADTGTIIIYLAIIGATLARFFSDLTPLDPMFMYSLSAILWITAFLGFAVLYAPMLTGIVSSQKD